MLVLDSVQDAVLYERCRTKLCRAKVLPHRGLSKQVFNPKFKRNLLAR